MSTIQQLKNFIRHGKQAHVANLTDDSSRKPAPQPRSEKDDSMQSFAPPQGLPLAPLRKPLDASEAPADGHSVQPRSAKAKRVDEEELKQFVAEEKANKNKFPRYPGLDRWELLEKMGDGAFSNVYRARDLHGDHGDVAIKVVRKFEMNSMQGNKHLHPDFKKTPKAAERANILKEVQIMRQLDHPNIIKLIEFSESKQYYYIVLEIAPGGELFHQIVRLTYFSEELSRHVIVRVAKALEYLHEEKGVIHRDIKPENILFNPLPFVPSKHPKPKQPGDEDKVDEGEYIPGQGAGGIGEIKIADFGLSKVVWESQTMTPCGTVGYTAPEIVKDERYSKSVDMWALGCVLYTLLCGFPPFYDESIEVLTEKVAEGQYTFLSPWWDDISQSARDLIEHLLAVDPRKRYTIKEFLAHPWIRASGPTPRDEKKSDSLRPMDLSKFEDTGKRYDFRSPGAVNLREVFDVSYAVHRQEEEGKMRQQLGARAGGARSLAGLNEEDEDEDGDDGGGGDGMQVDDQGAGHKSSAAAVALEQSMRRTNIREDGGRGREPHRAAMTAAARQQVRDRNRQKGPFELNLDNATLLGKRGKKVPAMGA